MTIVREGRPEDVDWILGQLRDFSVFFGSKLSLFESEDYARDYLHAMMKSGHLLLVAEQEGVGLVGFIGGIITPNLLNPSIRVLAEMFWWVAPDRRNSRAGAELLKHFVAWGRAHVDWITMSLEDGSPINDESLLRRGFKLKEKSYLMEVC